MEKSKKILSFRKWDFFSVFSLIKQNSYEFALSYVLFFCMIVLLILLSYVYGFLIHIYSIFFFLLPVFLLLGLFLYTYFKVKIFSFLFGIVLKKKADVSFLKFFALNFFFYLILFLVMLLSGAISYYTLKREFLLPTMRVFAVVLFFSFFIMLNTATITFFNRNSLRSIFTLFTDIKEKIKRIFYFLLSEAFLFLIFVAVHYFLVFVVVFIFDIFNFSNIYLVKTVFLNVMTFVFIFYFMFMILYGNLYLLFISKERK